ncbi:carbamoyl-phosphate synthase large subunit [Novosphingobium colocasiae]
MKEEGYRVVLVNSNPATIMTDPEFADATYVEPITPEIVAKIIEKERPDAVLPTMGGQTALNTALALYNDGTLEKFGVKMIGADADAIDKAENRTRFREAMDKIGLESARSGTAHTLEEAFAVLERTGLPSIIRPSFTLGGTGGGVAYNKAEFETIVRSGLDASPTTEVLIEESLLGWKEYEMEVVRDRKDNAIIICSIENVDPMGVHTGDSITVAPALTLTDKEYQIMRTASIAVLREIGVETGGSNVQFAVNPADGRLIVIEMNPRVSRSSALASKATGFPIARVAAKLAVGYTLDEITNEITGATPASFEPTIDYVVTKIPRFAFEKFKGAEPLLTTAMKSVGEVMAIGRNIKESMQKALRGLETGLDGFNRVPALEGAGRDTITAQLARATPERLLVVGQALREGFTVDEIHAITHYDKWFLRHIAEIIAEEAQVMEKRPADRCRRPAPAESHGLFPTSGLPRWRCARSGWRAGWARPRRAVRACCTMPCARWQGPPARKRSAACAASWASTRCSSASIAAPPNSRRSRHTCIRPMKARSSARPRTRRCLRIATRSSFWAADRTGSGRGSSLTIAASTPASRWQRRAMKRSWSTATPKPYRPITTRRTASISSR